METIYVVAAVIRDENRILVTQRGYGEFNGFWEFPGGKIEQGETAQTAIIREIKEETGLDIEEPRLCGIKEWMNEDGSRYIVFLFKTACSRAQCTYTRSTVPRNCTSRPGFAALKMRSGPK